MNKAFSNFTWENDPSVNTPLSADNLNKVNSALDTVDTRVVQHETTKANQTDMLTAITSVSLDENTGIFTFTRHNGTSFTVDTKLEKIVLNYRFDSTTQILYLILEDGTEMPVDLSAFITNVEFADSKTIRYSITDGDKVVFDIIDGSITGDKLEPNYLANVQIQAENASKSASNASHSATEAEASAVRAEEAAEKAAGIVGGDFATNSRVDDIVNGTTKVGNSDKLDGHEAEYFATAESVSNIQTTSKTYLSQSGWYRVAEYDGTQYTINGSTANACDLIIKRSFANTNNEQHFLRLLSANGVKEFASMGSKSRVQCITKVRYTRDVPNLKAYIEVYYAGTTAEMVHFTVNNAVDGYTAWKTITPMLTEETVDGVTVDTTYDIPANASPATSVDLANYFKNTGGNINGNVAVSGEFALFTTEAINRVFRSKNANRSILYAVYSDGGFVLYDETNGKQIINSSKAGTNTFNGNLSIPKASTSLDGDILITTAGTLLRMYENGGNKRGAYLNLGMCKSNINTEILHTNNSAKVVVSDAAPSDTSAVWFDTSEV